MFRTTLHLPRDVSDVTQRPKVRVKMHTFRDRQGSREEALVFGWRFWLGGADMPGTLPIKSKLWLREHGEYCRATSVTHAIVGYMRRKLPREGCRRKVQEREGSVNF